MLAFVHIEKTAGTSLIHILRHNYFLRYLDVRPYSVKSHKLFTPNDLQIALRINPILSAIGGHSVVPYNGLESTSEQIKYITLLRDPLKRYVSQHRHWVEKKKLKISFAEFIQYENLWNFQTKKIAGHDDVDVAKDILRERFLTVGVVERFDEFLILLKRSLNISNFDIRYKIQNIASDRAASDNLISAMGDEIRKRNENDLELYRFVNEELIPEKRRFFGDAIDIDLYEFRRENMHQPNMCKRYIDYGYRKAYVEPLSGFLRVAGGLPYKGSY